MSSIIEQADIDALLREAQGLADSADFAPPPAPPPPPPPAPPPRPAASPAHPAGHPELDRLLRIRVAAVVQLASRLMSISAVRNLSIGAIIEFEKSVEEPLDLMIGNQLTGHGICIKVGENFGLRITVICDKSQRIRSMGRQ